MRTAMEDEKEKEQTVSAVEFMNKTLGLIVSKRTLERKRKEGKRLSHAESDLLIRSLRVYAQAMEAFDSRDKARRWLKKSNRALDGRTPLSLLDTDAGTRSVEDELYRIEYGEYS